LLSQRLVVSIDGSSGVWVLARAKGVGRSDLLAVDVRDTEPSKLLAVDNGHDSEGGSGLSNVSPRDSVRGARCAGLVRPGLSGSVFAGHTDDGTALSLAVGLDDEVVVAASVVLTTIAAQVIKGPCLVSLDRVRASGYRDGRGSRARAWVGWVAATGDASRNRYHNGREVRRWARSGVSRVAAAGNAGSYGRSGGCRKVGVRA
jgi:hypothetical protein